jgi:hypothetical protein
MYIFYILLRLITANDHDVGWVGKFYSLMRGDETAEASQVAVLDSL